MLHLPHKEKRRNQLLETKIIEKMKQKAGYFKENQKID